MKVSDLIEVLEKYKDKNLYMLNVASPNEVINISQQIIDDDFFLILSQKPDHKFISDFISLEEGFSVRHRTEPEMEAIKKARIREERQFNYFFKEGDEVVVDEDIVLELDKKRISPWVGKKGTVLKCGSDMHAFGQGTSYYHIVEWNDGSKTQDGEFGPYCEYDNESCMPKNHVPTIYLKKYEL
jgi:hypothetical protein